MSQIKLSAINKIYALGEHAVHALRDVNLTIDSGSMTAIMGASGSGKSTLMNIIGFLDTPTSGQYFFNGEDVSSLSQRDLAFSRNRKIGFIFQSFFLLSRCSALENVMLPLFYRNIPRHIACERAMQKLEQLDIAHLALHKPQQLSGGQQQRVAIARALVQETPLILADEPTGALDSTTGKEVMEILTNLHRQEGRTIVIITHDHAVSQLCERIISIKDGYIVNN